MDKTDPQVRSADAMPAHEIRLLETAVWSLYTLSENPSLSAEGRAACRIGADFAVANLKPGDSGVAPLVQLVIEAGGGEQAPGREMLLARLRQAGWSGEPSALDKAPEPLRGPPPRNLVSDQKRAQALERILKAIERHLPDGDLSLPERNSLAASLGEIRSSKLDIRTRTERAWALLELVERNLLARARETGAGD
jgi:hypothetical protein